MCVQKEAMSVRFTRIHICVFAGGFWPRVAARVATRTAACATGCGDRVRRSLLRLLSLCALGGLVIADPTLVLARTAGPVDPAALCERAATQASAETRVPHDILLAIALTETGRTRDGQKRPWPWALNFGGPGAWLATRAEAEARLRAELAMGRRNIDVGCFQINHRWHSASFPSSEQMFDPVANARYAARFLRSLYEELGDWNLAAGAYHSRTPALAQRYRDAFSLNLAALRDAPRMAPRIGSDGMPSPGGAPMAGPVRDAVLRVNTFPLLRAGTPASAGSLMPDVPAVGLGLLMVPRRGLAGQG
jgi:hypothetical protein